MTFRACITYREKGSAPRIRWEEVEARDAAGARREAHQMARGYRWRDEEGRQWCGRVLSVGAVMQGEGV